MHVVISGESKCRVNDQIRKSASDLGYGIGKLLQSSLVWDAGKVCKVQETPTNKPLNAIERKKRKNTTVKWCSKPKKEAQKHAVHPSTFSLSYFTCYVGISS